VAYVGNPHYLLNTKKLFSGKIKGVEVPYERSLDIDTEFDLLVAEKILADTYRKNSV
jgi:CMP-N-acetylneuraminic acid synthetase